MSLTVWLVTLLPASNVKSKNRLSENISVLTSPSKANYGANRNSPSTGAFGSKRNSILNARSSKRNSKAYFNSLSGNINNSKDFDSPSQPQLQESVSLSHMWTELDNLDNFFTQDNASTSFWSTWAVRVCVFFCKLRFRFIKLPRGDYTFLKFWKLTRLFESMDFVHQKAYCWSHFCWVAFISLIQDVWWVVLYSQRTDVLP